MLITARSTEKLSCAVTARTPGTLLAEIATPSPVPQTNRCTVGPALGDHPGSCHGDVRIGGVLAGSDSDVDHRGDTIVGLQIAAQNVLVLQACVVAAHHDA